MLYNFCTLFDTHYFSRGLALYYSLEKNCPDFHLYIFAFDQKADDFLRGMKLSKATIISLKEFEDDELLRVKPTRSIAEYCWTCTSSTILYVLEKYNVESCTYLDADLFFYSSPQPIFEELGNESILITEHRYSPQYNKQLKAGRYCVQFVTFRNNHEGLTALKWWREKCIEWCYARYEDGKFGDQLYLEDWTERFKGVHVLQHAGGGLAAWNIQQYTFEKENDKVTGTEITTGRKFEAIFYHFHYLKFYTNNQLEFGRRTLSEEVINIFYKPYVIFLEELRTRITSMGGSFDPHGTQVKPTGWKTPILFIYRKMFGIYNIFDKSDFLRK
ncbi:MAG: glycosyl transferase [Ignavibacteriaceae bacterium]|nr:glycosyl transferase [Ignavibacteriaceae bacterium]